MRDYVTPKWHIIYGVFDDRELVYVGSSDRSISKLEYNHRNWQTLTDFHGRPFTGSNFRRALVERGTEWEFKVLLSRHCDRADAEWLEEQMLLLTEPRYNKDLTPYHTSIREGRISPLVETS